VLRAIFRILHTKGACDRNCFPVVDPQRNAVTLAFSGWESGDQASGPGSSSASFRKPQKQNYSHAPSIFLIAMPMNTDQSSAELGDAFSNLRSRQDVADLLKIELQKLTFLLHGLNPDAQYKTFKLKKSRGGFREICAPMSAIKTLQRRLNVVFQAVYRPRYAVQGFVAGKSIVSNAEKHVGARYVLNIDLEDFFPSINFGRIRGLFLTRPYELPEVVATVLAQICCYEGRLPQGAPTSPVVSNMICSRLDSEFHRLARDFRCMYSRYADDIVLSTRLPRFPDKLARLVSRDEGNRIEIGAPVQDIISDNGFSLNESKTRLQSRYMRQEVTGITINQFPNVPRRFVRQLRSMIYAWDRWGLDKAQKEYIEKYRCNGKQRAPGREPPAFQNVVEGRLNFLRMVRGQQDRIYRKLYYMYAKVAGKDVPEYYKNPALEVGEGLWIIESDETQGTAFSLRGIDGLVTCRHVCGTNMTARKWNSDREYSVELARFHSELDVAVIKGELPISYLLEPDYESQPSRGEEVIVAGFPNFRKEDEFYSAIGRITNFRGVRSLWEPGKIIPGVRSFTLDTPIFAGNSGGPVLSRSMKVIGIAARGSENMDESRESEDQAAIPIRALQLLGQT
jgi:RNA-directed DNA polymerase